MRILFLAVITLPLLLTGCALNPTAAPTPQHGLPITGHVHGGQQPITAAHVYLFTANTTGYGGTNITPSTSNASLSLLNAVATGHSDSVGAFVLTDANGNFTISGDYTCTSGQQVYLYALGGNPGAGTNSASGLLAALGNCPAAGNFLTTIPSIWLNEVSTIAAAYAFAGFASDATHVSSSGTTLAQTGIANAFSNATNLANIATGVALTTTPAANGTVPQTEINTLANVLASCINSTGSASTPCTTLFANAQSAGSSGTAPTDTATAAINIAHHPANAVSNLFALQSSAATPFLPDLSSSPGDFTLALTFTGGGPASVSPQSIAVDASGNIWTVKNSSPTSIYKFSPLGDRISPAAGYTDPGLSSIQDIAIDSLGNVWLTDFSNARIFEFSNTGAAITTSAGYSGAGLNSPIPIAIDASDHIWVGSGPAGSGRVSEFTSAGVPLSPTTTGFRNNGIYNPSGLAIDGSGSVWISNYAGIVGKISSAGVDATGGNGYTGTAATFCGGSAIDASGSAWIVGTSPASLTRITTDTTISRFTAANLSKPIGIAADGSGNLWLANSAIVTGAATAAINEFAGNGVEISSASGYTTSSATTPSGIATDSSGNVWFVDSTTSLLSEFVGAATPVVVPLSAAVKNNTIATRP